MIYAIKLKNSRKKQIECLNTKEKYLFYEIVNEIYSYPMSFKEKEILLQDILDMLIENQNQGRSVEFIVGEDYRIFCRDIFENFYENNLKLFSFISIAKRTLISFFIISLIVFIFSGELKGNIGSLFGMFIIANIAGFSKEWGILLPKVNMKNIKCNLYDYLTINKNKKTAIVIFTLYLLGLSLINLFDLSQINFNTRLIYLLLIVLFFFLMLIEVRLRKNIKIINKN